MHLWHTRKLAIQIAQNGVPAGDKKRYVYVLMLSATVFSYVSYYLPPTQSWFLLYEGVVVTVITFAGVGRLINIYGKPLDAAFFEMIALLAVPLWLKTTLLSWAAAYLAYWMLSTFGGNMYTLSPSDPDPVRYGLGRLWDSIPFLAVVIAAFIFWWRLGDHVRYVESKVSGA